MKVPREIDSDEVKKRRLNPTGKRQNQDKEADADEPDLSENDSWNRLTREQFFSGYAESDSVYNSV